MLCTAPVGAEELGETVGKVLRVPQPPGEHTFWLSDVMLHRAALFDGDAGKMLGSITAGSVGVGFIISPMPSHDHKEIYIPESYFSRGVRGDRTDVVTVYDGASLMPTGEIPIPPKRAEYFPGNAANAMLDDGRFLAIFNVTPAQSATVVDAPARKLTAEVQSPGCSLVYPAGARRFFLLCADGTALVVTLDDNGAVASAARTPRFFDADKDPITEKGARLGNVWHFVSYAGVVHSIDVSGDAPKFGETWPLLTDADRKETWRIGGEQHLAIHQKTGRLYVIMHKGPADTHKWGGPEVWVYDVKTHQRLQRIATQNPISSFIRLQSETGMSAERGSVVGWLLDHLLPNPGTDGILVTQDDHPLLIGLSIAFPFALSAAGGWGGIAHLQPTADYWSLVKSGSSGLVYLAMLAPAFVVSPGLLQKVYGAKDAHAVRWGVGLNALGLFLYAIVPVLLGMMARASFPDLPARDLALPTLLMKSVPPLIGSLGLAAVFSAEISAADAVLFMLTTSVARDLYARFIQPSADERRQLVVARVTAVGLGIVSVMIAMTAESIIDALSIFYTLMGVGLFVPILAGLFVPRATTAGALAATLSGIAAVLAVQTFGHPGPSWMTPAMFGLLTSVVAMAASLAVLPAPVRATD